MIRLLRVLRVGRGPLVHDVSLWKISIRSSNFTYLGVNQLRRKYRIISTCHRHCLQTKLNRSRGITSQRIWICYYGRYRQNHETPDNVRPFTAHLILAFESSLTFKGLSLCLWQWLTHMIFQYPPPILWTTCLQFIGLYGIIQNSWLTCHYCTSPPHSEEWERAIEASWAGQGRIGDKRDM